MALWTVTAFLITGTIVILARNSTWPIEKRSLRELRFLEIDGFIAPLLALAILPSMHFFGVLVERFDSCARPYGELFGMALPMSFSIGFAISGLHQKNKTARVFAVLTLAVLVVPFLLPTLTT